MLLLSLGQVFAEVIVTDLGTISLWATTGKHSDVQTSKIMFGMYCIYSSCQCDNLVHPVNQTNMDDVNKITKITVQYFCCFLVFW